MTRISEDAPEQQTLQWFSSLGYQTAHGPDLAPERPVTEELIRLAKDMRAAAGQGQKLGLNENELAFYDALEFKDSAVAVRDNVRAKLRTMVKRILQRYKYPPDKQEVVVETVIRQAELLSESWVA